MKPVVIIWTHESCYSIHFPFGGLRKTQWLLRPKQIFAWRSHRRFRRDQPTVKTGNQAVASVRQRFLLIVCQHLGVLPTDRTRLFRNRLRKATVAMSNPITRSLSWAGTSKAPTAAAVNRGAHSHANWPYTHLVTLGWLAKPAPGGEAAFCHYEVICHYASLGAGA